MALPGTPGGGQQVSMSQINTELGRSATATISLNTAENGGYGTINTCSQYYPLAADPATLNEWHGYNHSAACLTAYTMYYYGTGDGLYGGTDATQACAATNTFTVYGSTSTIQAGTRLYYNSNGTSEVEGSNNTIYYWFKIGSNSFSYLQGTGNGVSSLGSCSSPSYYHYTVDAVYTCNVSFQCVVSSYTPANGRIAYTSTLPFNVGYVLDATSGYIFHINGYYGLGGYGGQLITIGGVNATTCANLCTI